MDNQLKAPRRRGRTALSPIAEGGPYTVLVEQHRTIPLSRAIRIPTMKSLFSRHVRKLHAVQGESGPAVIRVASPKFDVKHDLAQQSQKALLQYELYPLGVEVSAEQLEFVKTVFGDRAAGIQRKATEAREGLVVAMASEAAAGAEGQTIGGADRRGRVAALAAEVAALQADLQQFQETRAERSKAINERLAKLDALIDRARTHGGKTSDAPASKL